MTAEGRSAGHGPLRPAAELARLDLDAHAATKLRARRLAGTALREAIDADDVAYQAQLAAQPAG